MRTQKWLFRLSGGGVAKEMGQGFRKEKYTHENGV
jgi:hypothetical protein